MDWFKSSVAVGGEMLPLSNVRILPEGEPLNLAGYDQEQQWPTTKQEPGVQRVGNYNYVTKHDVYQHKKHQCKFCPKRFKVYIALHYIVHCITFLSPLPLISLPLLGSKTYQFLP